MPPSVIRSNAKKYRHPEATTETYEFPGRSHFTGVEPGWEQVPTTGSRLVCAVPLAVRSLRATSRMRKASRSPRSAQYLVWCGP